MTAPAQTGFTTRRTWSVWANQVEHRVDVELNAMTGSTKVFVDGELAVKRGIWHMDMSGFELPFDVGGRSCLFVVRSRYGAAPEFDLYSEGRSLTTGEELSARRAAASRELPNLVRMLLLFIPLIGGVNTALLRGDTIGNALGGWAPWLLIGAGVAVAAAGWWVASRWYAGQPTAPARHLVGAAIVTGAWLVFGVVFVVLLTIGADEAALVR